MELFWLLTKLATKGTTDQRSTSPSVNRTEPEKEEESKLGHSIRYARVLDRLISYLFSYLSGFPGLSIIEFFLHSEF